MASLIISVINFGLLVALAIFIFTRKSINKAEPKLDDKKEDKIPHKSGFTSKLQQMSTPILAFATLMLFISTMVYAIFTGFTGQDIRTALEYYSSERTLSILWDEYKYDRDMILPYVALDERPVIENDLRNIFWALKSAEKALHDYRRLPNENYISVENALTDFCNDYSKIPNENGQ